MSDTALLIMWILLSWLLVGIPVALLFGRVVRQRDRQVPHIPDDGQSIDSLANAVRETKLGRAHDAQFAVWEQELRERERHDG